MKKRILLVILCIAMLLSSISLIACDSESDKGKNPPVSNNDGDGNKDTGNVDDDDASNNEQTQTSENKLYRKTVIWNGDSICQGATSTGTWADRIAAKNELKEWKNYGVGGGTITENVLYQSGAERHSVSASLEQMYEECPHADYIILEGGTNDADLLGRITEGETAVRFGSVDENDFSGNYDRNTFCGALESIFYRAKQYWPGKTICFIVAQKMGLKESTVANRYAYFKAAMEICEKWEIPYLNLWDDCYLDPTQPHMYDPNKTAEENEQSLFYRDGQHLTGKGYDITADMIDEWLKTL